MLLAGSYAWRVGPAVNQAPGVERQAAASCLLKPNKQANAGDWLANRRATGGRFVCRLRVHARVEPRAVHVR